MNNFNLSFTLQTYDLSLTSDPLINAGLVLGGDLLAATQVLTQLSAASSNPVAAIFLTDVTSLWVNVIVWTMGIVAVVFWGAGLHACRVHANEIKIDSSRDTDVDVVADRRHLWLWLHPAAALFGSIIGFMHGAIPAALISAIAISIPYPVGLDIAAGLGISQAIIIVYFHLGRADFIHR